MRAPAAPLPITQSAGRAPAPDLQPKAQPGGLENLRPQAVAQRQLAEFIRTSPRMVAQAKRDAALRGEPVQCAGPADEEMLLGKFAPAQLAGPEEEEMVQGKFAPAQLAGPEEEELLQGKFAPAQLAGPAEEELLQGKVAPGQRAAGAPEAELLQGKFAPVQRAESASASEPRENKTGLPDELKAGVESLSGMSLDHVQVHYNSAQPAQLDALAYAQGSDIHVAPGQEQHLPHEAWHVVQQAQGRVKPTIQMKGGSAHGGPGLEARADGMGAEAAGMGAAGATPSGPLKQGGGGSVVQRYVELPNLADGMISEGGHLAVTGPKDAWGSNEKIGEAQSAFKQAAGPVTLEKGAAFQPKHAEQWKQAFGSQKLYRMTPVYKEATDKKRTTHEPVSGETSKQRTEKLAAYKSSLRDGLTEVTSLYVEIANAWKQAEKVRDETFLSSVRSDAPGTTVYHAFNGKVPALIIKTMGALWCTHPKAKAVLNPLDKTALTLQDYGALFTALSQALTQKIETDLQDEASMQELVMSLPNDCKQAAMLLTGKGAVALSNVNEDPGIGDNYFKAFGTEYGWRTHYATVIAKDASGMNTDNVTFEAAADFEAKIEKGKSLGFFEMYGTETPEQTFEHRILGKQRDYIGRQTEAELKGASTDKEKTTIRNRRDSDCRKIDTERSAL